MSVVCNWVGRELDQIGQEVLQREARTAAATVLPHTELSKYVTPEAVSKAVQHRPDWRCLPLETRLNGHLVARIVFTYRQPVSDPASVVLKVCRPAATSPAAGSYPHREVAFYNGNPLPATGAVTAPRCLQSELHSSSGTVALWLDDLTDSGPKHQLHRMIATVECISRCKSFFQISLWPSQITTALPEGDFRQRRIGWCCWVVWAILSMLCGLLAVASWCGWRVGGHCSLEWHRVARFWWEGCTTREETCRLPTVIAHGDLQSRNVCQRAKVPSL